VFGGSYFRPLKSSKLGIVIENDNKELPNGWRVLPKRYMASSVREVFGDGVDEDVPEASPATHQTCHHWASEVRQEVLDEFWRSGK
jgi:hypothetical protein